MARIARSKRPDIKVENDTLKPRIRFAKEIGVSERTMIRMNLPTTYFGNVAYIFENASRRQMAARKKYHE